MKRKNLSSITIVLLIVVMVMTACGSKKDASYEGKTGRTSPMETTTEESMDLDYSSQSSDSGAYKEEAEETVQNESKNSNSVETNRKLIKRVQMDVETKDFEGLLESINAKVDNLNGYMETSEVSGNAYFDEYDSRYAHMVIRIPSTNLDKFVTTVKELGNVINSSESTDDITLQYVDVESHKEALIVEQDRLLEIIKDAKKLEDIIKIEERLSEVRYEIGSYESQIRTFDNLVDYSTITLDINEVQHITPVEDKTVLQRMQSGLSNTLFEIKIASQNFVVWFVTNLPYLIIWIGIFGIAVVIIRKRLLKLNKQNLSTTLIKDNDKNEKESNVEGIDSSKNK